MATSSEGEEGDIAADSRDERLGSSLTSTDSVFDGLSTSSGRDFGTVAQVCVQSHVYTQLSVTAFVVTFSSLS